MSSARAITSGELIKLRSDKQFSQLFLAVIQPEVVFSCVVSGSYPSNDNVSYVYYGTVLSGSPSSVLADMTAFIGTTPGATDVGQVRIHGLMPATATYVTIARTSDIPWVPGLYFTVVREYNLWPKQAYFSGGTYYVDDDSAYTDQHKNPPHVPILGTDRVYELTGADVSVPMDASQSWLLLNGVVVSGSPSFLWDTPGASSIENSGGATPTVHYNQAGNYVITCYVTSSTGVVSLGHRVVYVWDKNHLPTTQFEVSNIAGSFQDGGWTFDVKSYAQADLYSVRDRAKVLIFSKDFYGAVEGSLGAVAGAENIIAAGWIKTESITQNPEQGFVKFSVGGPAYWLGAMANWPVMLMDVSITDHPTSDPKDWNEYKGLNYDAFYWHSLQWCSTATGVIDVFPSYDSRLRPNCAAPLGMLWGQITSVGDNNYLIHPCCNRYGQLYAQVDIQLIKPATEGSVPVVMALTEKDWQDNLEVERCIVNSVGMVDMFGLAWTGAGGDPGTAIRVRAFGNAIPRIGRIEFRQELTIAGEADADWWAGALLAQFNNPYPKINVSVAANNRFVDIAPYQFITVSTSASDTPRGYTMVNQKVVVRQVQLELNVDSGMVTATWNGEAKVEPISGVTVPIIFPAPIPTPPVTPPGGGGGGLPIIPGPIVPPFSPPGNLCLLQTAGPTGPYLANRQSGDTGWISTVPPQFSVSNRGLESIIRADSSINQTVMNITGRLMTSTDEGVTWIDATPGVYEDRWNAYAGIVEGTKIPYSGPAYGTRSVQLLPPAATPTFSYSVQMIPQPAWTDGEVIGTGSIGNFGAGDSVGNSFGGLGTTLPLTIGWYYSIEWGGEPLTPDLGWYRRHPLPDGSIIQGPRWDLIWHADKHTDGSGFYGCSQDTFAPTYDAAWAKYWKAPTYGLGWRIYFGPYAGATANLQIPYYLDDYNWQQNNDVMHWKVRRAFFNAAVVDVGMSIESVHVYNVCFKT